MSNSEEIKKELQNSGFRMVQLSKPYLPLKLKALAIGEVKTEHKHFPKEEVVTTKRVLAESLTRFKFFDDGTWYDLQCMFGRDSKNAYYLFCKEDSDKDAFKVMDGSFVFEFSAEQFFYLLNNASIANWGLFANSCVCNDRQEIAKFEQLINDHVLGNKWKTRAVSLINRLYYNLDNK